MKKKVTKRGLNVKQQTKLIYFLINSSRQANKKRKQTQKVCVQVGLAQEDK
jgi:hypothetical protein